MGIRRFEEIEAWKKARILTAEIYKLTGSPAFAKDYALQNQLRRAAVSIMSNIAEGFERDGNKEFKQFLSIAKGSAGEVKSQLYVAMDVGYLSAPEFNRLADQTTEVGRILANFIRYLANSELLGNKLKETSELYILDDNPEEQTLDNEDYSRN